MQTEEIILYFLRFFLGSATVIKAYLIWNYLNKKALGMQTILDQMVKDIIIINGMTFISSSLTMIKIVKTPYNHYVAITLLMFRYFFVLAVFWQIFVTVVIRYLSVFYHSILNSVDEVKIIKISRLFVGLMSLISTFLEGYENEVLYIWLTNKDIDKDPVLNLQAGQNPILDKVLSDTCPPPPW